MMHGPGTWVGAHTGLEPPLLRIINSSSLLERVLDRGRAVRRPPPLGDLAHQLALAVDQPVDRQAVPTARRLLARRMNAVRVGWPRGPTRAASSDDGSKMGVELAVGSRSAREVSSGCESVGPEPARRGTTGAVGGASDRREQRWASGLCEQRTGERKPMRTGRAQT